MSELSSRSNLALAAVVVALVAVLLGGQGLAAATAPADGVASTGRVLGRTSFAYLGGLRTFAAAVLWNRLEPVFDGYYTDRNVDEMVMFLPTMRLVQALDPQFEQSYYNSSFIVARRGRTEEAFAIARDGIENNPQSGLMLANYAQLLLMDDKERHLTELVKLAGRGVQADIKWASIDDQFEGYGVFRTVFNLAGNQEMVDALSKAQDTMRQQGASESTTGGLPADGGH